MRHAAGIALVAISAGLLWFLRWRSKTPHPPPQDQPGEWMDRRAEARYFGVVLRIAIALFGLLGVVVLIAAMLRGD